MKVAGKVALITGGAGGLGKAFAEALLRHGAKVCIVDFNSQLGEKTAQHLNNKYANCVIFKKCDVTSKTELEDSFKFAKQRFGRLDIVSNNAGNADEVNWEKQVQLNLVAVLRGTFLGLEHMGEANGGSGGVIINTASMAGLIPMFATPTYSATKHGVVGVSRALGADIIFMNHKVRVNCLCPSFTDTPLLAAIKDDPLVQATGYMQPDIVAEGFMRLVQEDNLNGAVMRITARKGIDIKTYPRSETVPSMMDSKL